MPTQIVLFKTKNDTSLWGYSSAGRAPDLHSGGQQFDPA
ncbi:hypothetical protein ALT1545_760001 [Alteromonas macleodii]